MLTRFLLTMYLLGASVQLAVAQDQLHVMLSRAPLPAWVNMNEKQYLGQTISQRKKMGWVFQKNTSDALSEGVSAQYNFLSSGRLLFNDEAGVLVNSIADKLLKNDTAFRSTINLCVYYSSGTNAIAYPNGFIVIELGLIAQMENEDQLAFMISHELAHVKNGDYITSEAPWEPDDWSAEIEKYMEYKRYREVEADLLAYEMYERAGYNLTQVTRVFEVLDRNWMVPTQLAFNAGIFSDSLFSYPGDIYFSLDESSPGVDDSKYYRSSQEVVLTRRSKLASYYKLDSVHTEYIPAAGTFAWVNKLAIYNCGLISLENKQYAAALYAGYYLHSTDSTLWEEADLLIGKALYLQAAIRSLDSEQNNTLTSEDIRKPEKFGNLFFWVQDTEDPDDVRGHILGAKNFLDRQTVMESMMLSVRWWWDYHDKTQRHGALATQVAAHSVCMFDSYTHLPVDSLATVHVLSYRPKTGGHDDDEEDEDDDVRIRMPSGSGEDMDDLLKDFKYKLDSLKNVKLVVKSPSYSDNGRYDSKQLYPLYADSTFRVFHKKYSRNSRTMDALDSKPVPEHLQADSVYLIATNHVWTREYKRTYEFRVKEEKTEMKTGLIRRNLETSSKSARVDLLTTDATGADSLTLDAYNNYCLARRVFSEATECGTETFTYPLAYKEEFDSTVAETHVTHALLDIQVTKQYTKIRSPVLWVASVIFPYTAPIALLWIVPSRKFTFHQTVVYNLQTGNVDYTWTQTGRGGGGAAQTGSFYSKVFRKLKKPKAK